jgi:hypothetical protein
LMPLYAVYLSRYLTEVAVKSSWPPLFALAFGGLVWRILGLV